MATKRKTKPLDLTAVSIKAGAIRFDEYGRILVDPAVQAEAEGFELPDWLPGGGGGGGGDEGSNIGCPVTACQPLTACVDAMCADCAPVTACQPESVCADAMCSDCVTACGPESVCTDMMCQECTPDATCEPESKCVDIFCKEKNGGCEINNGCTSDDDVIDVEPL